MESQYGEANQDRVAYNGISSADYPGYGSDLSVSCDAYSLKSTSPNRMRGGVDVGINTEYASETDPWKEALISRNMDLVNCCLQAIVGDLPSAERPYIGMLMTTVLKEVEDITVGKVVPIAESIFNKLAPLNLLTSSETTNESQASDLINEVIKKNSAHSLKIPNTYKRPQGTGPQTKRKKPAAVKTFSTFVCPGCERFVRNRSYCPACNAVALRIEKDVENGNPIPNCSHKDFKGATACRWCRYNKYNKYWRHKDQNSKNSPAIQPGIGINGEEVCLGCQTPLNEGATRCRPCYSLARDILKARSIGTPIPQCRHDNFSGCPDCESCRFNRFLKQRGIAPFKCGSCFELCTTPKCQACHNFGTSLEKAYGRDAIPQCLHRKREGAPSCLTCRYHLWKEGKMLPIGETPEKPQETVEFEPVMPWIKPDPEMDVKPDMKRIKMEIISPFEFEMA